MQTRYHTHIASAATAVWFPAFTDDTLAMSRREQRKVPRGENAGPTDALITRRARC